jgi:hypothetical protein
VSGEWAATVDVVSVQKGLTLSLMLPRRHLLRNALMRFPVSVYNGRRRAVKIVEDCENPRVDVEVLNSSGSIVYPPALPGGPQQRCPPGLTLELGSKRTLTRQVFGIMRGNRIRVAVTLQVRRTGKATTFDTVVGRTVTVPLDAGVAPRVHVQLSPTAVAVVRPRGALQHGAMMYFTQSAVCAGPNGSVYPFSSGGWAMAQPPTAGAYRFYAGCARPLLWLLVVGRLGQPVATLNYTKPGQ